MKLTKRPKQAMVKFTPTPNNSMNKHSPKLSGNSHKRCKAERPKTTIATIHNPKTKVAANCGIITASPLRNFRRVSRSCKLTQAMAAIKMRLLRIFTVG